MKSKIIACGAGLALMLLSAAGAVGQIRITGQASADYVKSNPGPSQYVVNSGRGTFGWRLDLFGDAMIAENIYFFSNFRLSQDLIPHIDQLAIRLTDLLSTGVSAEVGEIDLPFGDLGNRRFPLTNPFIDLPLTHEHLTSLRSSDYYLFTYDSRYTEAGNGLRLIDQGLYDLGAKLYGGTGIFDVAIALSNGMISSSSAYAGGYSSAGLNETGGLGKIVRLTVTPATGIVIGSSYASGAFIRQNNYYLSDYDPQSMPQHIVEGDFDIGFGHWTMYGEAFYNTWELGEAIGADLKAFGYSVETQFVPVPRISFALRAGEILFNSVSADLAPAGYGPRHFEGKWDHDVLRLEAAAGYRLDRSALLKVVFQWNRTMDVAEDPADNVLAFQLVTGF